VLIDYNTDFGFEIVTNLLIDDGNEEKDVRETLLSSNTESIAIVHTRHITNNMITCIVLAGKEIF